MPPTFIVCFLFLKVSLLGQGQTSLDLVNEAFDLKPQIKEMLKYCNLSDVAELNLEMWGQIEDEIL